MPLPTKKNKHFLGPKFWKSGNKLKVVTISLLKAWQVEQQHTQFNICFFILSFVWATSVW